MRTKILIVAIAILYSAGAFGYEIHKKKIYGNGNVVKQERQVESFNSISVSLGCKIYLEQGNSESLMIKTDENIQEVIETEVRNGELRISSEYEIRDKEELVIYLTVKELNKIKVSGALKLYAEEIIRAEEFSLDISGAADIDMKMETSKFYAQVGGTLKLDIEGKSRLAVYDISGVVDLNGFDFICDAVDIEFTGVGTANIYAEKILKAELSGFGRIKYKGNPQKIRKDVSGFGKISRH